MNSCILMAEIVQNPELRYTPDNQTAVAEMLVQFPGLREEDPPTTLKVVGWGNLAQEIQEKYHQGDRVILEGRLSMNTVDRPEGFKEKRAELVVQRVHSLTGATSGSLASPAATAAPRNATYAAPAAPTRENTPRAKTPKAPASVPAPSSPDFDDIPF